MTRILTQAQAEAVFSAMWALKNVGATIKASIQPVDEAGDWMFVEECQDSGQITVTKGLRRVACYASQDEFASSYSLHEPDPLQGAANWLVEAHPGLEIHVLAGKLSTGYNRAERLHAAAVGLAQTAIEH